MPQSQRVSDSINVNDNILSFVLQTSARMVTRSAFANEIQSLWTISYFGTGYDKPF